MRLNGHLGSYRCVQEGTPQGAVLLPQLFINQLFIDDIPWEFPPDVKAMLFVDDLARAAELTIFKQLILRL